MSICRCKMLVTLPDIHRLKKDFTVRLSNKPFLIWLLTTLPHLEYAALTLFAVLVDISATVRRRFTVRRLRSCSTLAAAIYWCSSLRDRDLYLYTAPGAESDVYDCFVVQCDGTCVKTPPDLFGDSPTERRRRNDGRQAGAYLPLCQPDSSSNHVRRHSGCRTTAMPDYLEKLYSARLAGDKYRAAQPVCSVSPLSLPRHSSLGM